MVKNSKKFNCGGSIIGTENRIITSKRYIVKKFAIVFFIFSLKNTSNFTKDKAYLALMVEEIKMFSNTESIFY